MYRLFCAAIVLSILALPVTAGEGGDLRLQAVADQSPPWQQHSGRSLLVAKKWDELSSEEKKRIREAEKKYKKLPQEKKEKLRKKWEKMPEKEREKYKIEKKYR